MDAAANQGSGLWSRRTFVVTGAVAMASFLAGCVGLGGQGGTSGATTASDGLLKPTPPQSAGPFYPSTSERRSDDEDEDLRSVDGQPDTSGTPFRLQGQVVDRRARPQPGLKIELWHTDSEGVYLDPADRSGSFDASFQGYGEAVTDMQGTFQFETIRPGKYQGRCLHFHFHVKKEEQILLTSQLYLPDDPEREQDGLFQRSGEDRHLLVVDLETAQGKQVGTIRIVLNQQ